MAGADLVPFAGLGPAALILVYAANFLGFLVRGAFGFGSNLPIVVLTTWVLGPHHAIVLTVLTALAAQVELLPEGLRGGADWGLARPLMAAMVAGTAAGTWVFAALPGAWLTVAMGLLIATLLGAERLGLAERLARAAQQPTALARRALGPALAALAAAAGTVGGGGGMYLLVAYLRRACREPARLRATNLVLSALFMASRVGFAALAGFVTARLLAETLVLLPAVFLGITAGRRLFRRASAARFHGALRALLAVAAVALLARGLSALG